MDLTIYVQATRVHCEEQLLSMRSFDGEIIAALGEQTAGNGEISSMLNLSSESSGRMPCSIEQIVRVEETLCSGVSKGGSDVAPIKQGIINSSMRESKKSKRIREVKPICQETARFLPLQCSKRTLRVTQLLPTCPQLLTDQSGVHLLLPSRKTPRLLQ
jgi:hypothetical protein